jgi:hypothetical protein
MSVVWVKKPEAFLLQNALVGGYDSTKLKIKFAKLYEKNSASERRFPEWEIVI